MFQRWIYFFEIGLFLLLVIFTQQFYRQPLYDYSKDTLIPQIQN